MFEKPKAFKRLIVHSQTGRFLKKDGGWTSDESEAMNFEDIVELLCSCSKHRVKNAEVVLRFTDLPRGEIRLPLPQHGL